MFLFMRYLRNKISLSRSRGDILILEAGQSMYSLCLLVMRNVPMCIWRSFRESILAVVKVLLCSS